MSKYRYLLWAITVASFLLNYGCNSKVGNKEYSNTSYSTNVYVGSPEDIAEGPCCSANSSDPGTPDEYYVNTETSEEDTAFTFRGWGDCTGQCAKDIEACVSHFIATEYHGEGRHCSTYQCGAFGIAHLAGTISLGHNNTVYIGYPGAGSPEDPTELWVDTSRLVHRESCVFSHYHNTREQGGDKCLDTSRNVVGEYEWFRYIWPEEVGIRDYYSRVNMYVIPTGYSRNGYTIEEVYGCTNEITYLLPVALTQDYYGLADYSIFDPDSQKPERFPYECIDGIDNDGDGVTDCDDPSCINVINTICD